MALTRRQKEVLDFLVNFIQTKGYSPSYEEVGEGLQLTSLATVHKHISGLQGKGYLNRGFNQSRSLEISQQYLKQLAAQKSKSTVAERSAPELTVPLLGKIAAGQPVETYAQGEQLHFSDFAGNPGTYALQVRGESMIEDHICPDDYVLIQKTETARDGDIVVALVEGSETTLKRFYREPEGKVRLQPANSSMSPIIVDGRDVAIQGKLLAVLRKYN